MYCIRSVFCLVAIPTLLPGAPVHIFQAVRPLQHVLGGTAAPVPVAEQESRRGHAALVPQVALTEAGLLHPVVGIGWEILNINESMHNKL